MPSNYPTSLDTEQSLYIAKNDFATTLTSNINNVQTTVPVSAITALPDKGLVSVDSEVILYTALQVSPPALLGCTRGFDGTAAATHASAARVEMRWVADHHNILASAIAAIEQELGTNPSGSVASVAVRLTQTEPIIEEITPASTDWSFTHTKGRVVNVQLYRKTGANTYELFEADIAQVIDATCEVNITLTSAEEGFAIAI